MKRFLVFCLLLVSLAGFAAADDLGIDAGLEVGFGDVADEFEFSLTPKAIYENSFGNIDVYAEANYTIIFNDDLDQSIYLEEEAAYNLPINETMLSFILNNQNNFYFIDAMDDDVDGVIEPSVKYAFSNFFAQLGFPIYYQPDTAVDTYLCLAYYNYGFGAELTGTFNIDPDAEMASYNLLLNYEQDRFYVEVEMEADKEFDVFFINPYAEFYIDRITVWAGVDFGNIGGEGDVTVAPYIGASYSF
ncbi:hypothetical protein LJC14_01845 [Treponema sp. OttesenSCG-928-L16]|nr:hypothetical protein [Treponema sp. OttesenSCG-928-L16]